MRNRLLKLLYWINYAFLFIFILSYDILDGLHAVGDLYNINVSKENNSSIDREQIIINLIFVLLLYIYKKLRIKQQDKKETAKNILNYFIIMLIIRFILVAVTDITIEGTFLIEAFLSLLFAPIYLIAIRKQKRKEGFIKFLYIISSLFLLFTSMVLDIIILDDYNKNYNFDTGSAIRIGIYIINVVVFIILDQQYKNKYSKTIKQATILFITLSILRFINTTTNIFNLSSDNFQIVFLLVSSIFIIYKLIGIMRKFKVIK